MLVWIQILIDARDQVSFAGGLPQVADLLGPLRAHHTLRALLLESLAAVTLTCTPPLISHPTCLRGCQLRL